MEQRGRLAGVVSTGAALFATQATMAVAGIIVAREVGPGGKGAITAVTTWAGMLAVVSLAGMAYAASVRVAEAPGRTATALANSLVHSLVVGGAVAVVAMLTLPATFARLDPGAEAVSYLALAAIPIGVLSECMLSILLAQGRRRAYATVRIAGPVVLLGATLVLAATGTLTVATAIAAIVAGSATSALLAAGLLPWRGLHADVKALLSDLRFGLKVHAGFLLGTAVWRLDVLIMSAFLASSQIGYYGVANNALSPVLTLTAAVSLLITPAVAGRAGGGDPVHIRDTTRRFVLVSAAAAAAIAIAAPLLVPLLFGAAFKPAVHLIWILAPGFVALGYADMVASAAIGMRAAWAANAIHLVGIVVTLALLPVLMARFEATGAAVASLCAYAASAAVAWYLVVRRRVAIFERRPGPAVAVAGAADR